METYCYDWQSQRPLLTRLTADHVTVETYYYDWQSQRPLLARLTADHVTVTTPSTDPSHSR